jgi:AraC-like DNA-binding protein
MEERKGIADRVVEYIINRKPLDFACLNVNEIARRFGVSVPHLSRTFKAEKGMGLRLFISREKIGRARFLLQRNREMSVKDIAAALDFCSTDYFIRVFKEQYGVTPGMCRRIDGGFCGLNDRRQIVPERRTGPEDRRNGGGVDGAATLTVSAGIEVTPTFREKRLGPPDRREGPDTRSQNSQKTYL